MNILPFSSTITSAEKCSAEGGGEWSNFRIIESFCLRTESIRRKYSVVLEFFFEDFPCHWLFTRARSTRSSIVSLFRDVGRYAQGRWKLKYRIANLHNVGCHANSLTNLCSRLTALWRYINFVLLLLLLLLLLLRHARKTQLFKRQIDWLVEVFARNVSTLKTKHNLTFYVQLSCHTFQRARRFFYSLKWRFDLGPISLLLIR